MVTYQKNFFSVIKKIIVSMIGVLFLAACTKNASNPKVTAIKAFIHTSCNLNQKADTNRDIILATLYFDTNNTSLNREDQLILDKVIKVYKNCSGKIMVIGDISTLEYNLYGNNQSYKLAYNRVKTVYNYLASNIDTNLINYIFCDSTNHKYIEQKGNPASIKGNQRVDIALINTSFVSNYFICLNKL